MSKQTSSRKESLTVEALRQFRELCKSGTAKTLRQFIRKHQLTRNQLNCDNLSYNLVPSQQWNEYQFLPLNIAIQARNLDTARALVHLGADFGERDFDTKQCPRELVPWEWRDIPEFQPPWCALGKYDISQYKATFNGTTRKDDTNIHPADTDYPMEFPDIPYLMRHHNIPLAENAPDHPLRIVVQQQASNQWLEFGEKVKRSNMKTEFSCMQFLFPDETEETLEAWCQYVVRQTNTEWNLGVWDGATAQGFVDFASKRWRQFNGGGSGFVGPSFRTVWPSAWRFPLPTSCLENALRNEDYHGVVSQVVAGQRLERPEMLATEAFYLAPEIVRSIVCQIGVPSELRTEFLAWLRAEDAHPIVLENLEQTPLPLEDNLQDIRKKLLESVDLLATSAIQQLFEQTLTPLEQARLLAELASRPRHSSQEDLFDPLFDPLEVILLHSIPERPKVLKEKGWVIGRTASPPSPAEIEGERKLVQDRQMENLKLAVTLKDKPRLRDIQECKKCRHFYRHKEDGTCGCSNVYRWMGHPWCSETRLAVTEDLFEKVHICLRGECPATHN